MIPRLALICLLFPAAVGCLPAVEVTPRAPDVAKDSVSERRAQVFDAISAVLGDQRLARRHEVWRLLVQTQDRAGIERGKDAALSKAAGELLNPILGAAGGEHGEPVELSADDRTRAATAFRGLAARVRRGPQ